MKKRVSYECEYCDIAFSSKTACQDHERYCHLGRRTFVEDPEFVKITECCASCEHMLHAPSLTNIRVCTLLKKDSESGEILAFSKCKHYKPSEEITRVFSDYYDDLPEAKKKEED